MSVSSPMPDVAVIDYGVGNLLSVRRGFEYWNAEVEVTSDPTSILGAPRVVLPGVGAFGDAGENSIIAILLRSCARWPSEGLRS